MWVRQALYEAYDEVRAQQQRATHRQKRNYDSKAVARTFPMGSWALRYYPPARKDKLCSPWIGPYKIVRAPMEWVVGIQVDAEARIFYVHMDDLKHCTPPDPEPSWPEVARGTSIVVSTRAPSTLACTEMPQIHTTSGSAHQSGSVSTMDNDVRASSINDQQLLTLGDKKYIRQLAKYTRMDYVKRCVNTRFELASPTLQHKWLCEQFQTWTEIITARILSDPAFKQALLDSCGSPLHDPDDLLYASAMMSSRNLGVKNTKLIWPSWIDRPSHRTRAQVTQ